MLGGKYVTTVAGAVPNVMPEVAVPPVISSLLPNALPPGSTHVVVSTNCVPEPAVLALICMYCPV
jgi:hypothetical protein